MLTGEAADLLGGEADLPELMLLPSGSAAAQGVLDGQGLLADLLEHEVRVAAPLRRLGVPVDVEDLLVHRAVLEVDDVDAVRSQLHDLPGVQEVDLPAV